MKVEQIVKTSYEDWMEKEGVPIHSGYAVSDLQDVELLHWDRKGCKGAFISLEGAQHTTGAYVVEIPAGEKSKPQKHLYEEWIYVLRGKGSTIIRDGEYEQILEWEKGSLFSPPANVWHQHINLSLEQPAMYISVSLAPILFNIFHNAEFIFQNDFVFGDRLLDWKEGVQGHPLRKRLWHGNFIADARNFALQEWAERGAGGTNVFIEAVNNVNVAHISEFPVGTYKKAHRHAPGAHIIILKGQGYSLMWPPDSQEKTRVNWQEDSFFVPPGGWYHQHFNVGKEPARYLALHYGAGKRFFGVSNMFLDLAVARTMEGGLASQIEYDKEDPQIRKMYEQVLAEHGVG